MYLLDTNVLSEIMRPMPNVAVIDWLNNHSPLYISTITQAELLAGAYMMADGKKKQAYLTAIDEMLKQDFAGKVLAFDGVSANHYAHLVAERKRIGKPIHTADAQIASIATAYGLHLVTRNTKDFVLIENIINPFGD